MPELPEVETVRRGLAPVMDGARIADLEVNRPNLRYPFPEKFTERLIGRRIGSVGRRAKYLTVALDSMDVLIMHLGMSGSFRIEMDDENKAHGLFYHPKTSKRSHDHVTFKLEGSYGEAAVVYNDPRRFGFMDLVHQSNLDTCKHFAGMGIEPTGNQLDGKIISHLFHGKSTPLKSALLDQGIIAGLGNIYVCEALWRAGLSPRRKASTIARKNGQATERSDTLATHIRNVISEAIEAGGSSLRDHRQANGELGYFQHQFNVYDREGEDCTKSECDGKIRRIVQSGRSTFFCPACQR